MHHVSIGKHIAYQLQCFQKESFSTFSRNSDPVKLQHSKMTLSSCNFLSSVKECEGKSPSWIVTKIILWKTISSNDLQTNLKVFHQSFCGMKLNIFSITVTGKSRNLWFSENKRTNHSYLAKLFEGWKNISVKWTLHRGYCDQFNCKFLHYHAKQFKNWQMEWQMDVVFFKNNGKINS